jgi:hypothetical protein
MRPNEIKLTGRAGGAEGDARRFSVARIKRIACTRTNRNTKLSGVQ